MPSDSYAVHVVRDGDVWLADIPSLTGAHTHAWSMDGLLTAIREVIILCDDLPDDAEVVAELRVSLCA